MNQELRYGLFSNKLKIDRSSDSAIPIKYKQLMELAVTAQIP